MFFSKDLLIKLSDYPFSIVTYKYSNSNYYFTLTHSETNTFSIKILYYQITFDGENVENIKKLEIMKKDQHMMVLIGSIL